MFPSSNELSFGIIIITVFMKLLQLYYVICMYRIYSERKCIDGDFMNALRRFKTVILYMYPR